MSVKVFKVSVDEKLARLVDLTCGQRGMTRAALLRRGIELAIREHEDELAREVARESLLSRIERDRERYGTDD